MGVFLCTTTGLRGDRDLVYGVDVHSDAVIDVVRYPFVYGIPHLRPVKAGDGGVLCAAVEFNDGRIVDCNTGG